jgi:hypothetical protein
VQANSWPTHTQYQSVEAPLQQIGESESEEKSKLTEDDVEYMRMNDPWSHEQMKLLGELDEEV